MRRTLVCALLGLSILAGDAMAADPGRWVVTSNLTLPAWYRQGLASDPATGDVFFAGSFEGIYRTRNLTETLRNAHAIPKDVMDRERYNHIGDIAWDAGEGGRLLLPLEGYDPFGGADTNPGDTGSVGVVDPKTLRWKYYVKLDPAEIDKAMWVATDPSGLLWTQINRDLLAFNLADVSPANAAPGAAPIKPVKRLTQILPEGAAGGAVYHEGRLLIPGLIDGVNRVLSVNLTTGVVETEVERATAHEPEGMDIGAYADGILHWAKAPGFGLSSTELTNLVPKGSRLRLTLSRTRVKARRKARLTATVRVVVGNDAIPIRDVEVRIASRKARTDARGRAKLNVKLARGRYRAQAFFDGLRSASRTLSATRR
jgi:hypothetical protein